MTAARRLSLNTGYSHPDLNEGCGEKAFRKSHRDLSDRDYMHRLVVQALWGAFPGHSGDDSLSKEARKYFYDKHGEPISARTIKYWLRGDTLPGALHIATLVRMQPKVFLTAWLGSGV